VSYNILIGNNKGGVAKTTTTITVGHALTYAGYRVLILDLDAQGHCAVALGLERAPEVHDLLVYGKAEVHATGRDNLFLLPSNGQTSVAESVITGRPFSHLAITKAIKAFEDAFDFILMDTPPGVRLLTVAALMAAARVLIPVSCEELALDGLVEYTASIAEARENGAKCELSWVVPTMYDRVSKEIGRNFQALAEAYPKQIIAPIPRDTRMREAPAYGKTIWEYSARSTSAIAYTQLVKRILADLELEVRGLSNGK
jgi:chromosome partitioning protein